MTPNDNFNELRSLRDAMLNAVREAELPHVEVRVFNGEFFGSDGDTSEGSPLDYTAMNFEMLLNSLMSTYAMTHETNPITILAYVSQSIVELSHMANEVTIANSPRMAELDDEYGERLEEVKDIVRQNIKRKREIEEDTTEIPDVFKDAFNHEGEE